MEIGIFGLPQSGKTTIFSLLTGVEAGVRKGEATTGVGKVFDPRVAALSAIYKPVKTTYTTLTFVDLAGYDLAAKQKEKSRIFQHIQDADAVLAVVRAFTDPSVPWPLNYEAPARQLRAIKSELLIRDMEVVDTRLTRLREGAARKRLSPEEEKELALLEVVQQAFDEEKLVSQIGFSEEDLKALGSLALFTAKPIIVVVNTDEEQFHAHDYPEKQAVQALCQENGFALLELSGKIEMEINALDEADREPFMQEMGIEESGIQRLSRVVYRHMGLISFLTAGEDEVRAWTIRRGTNAQGAAAKIHTDLATHFIRAEMVAYDTFMQFKDMNQAKAKGLVKLAGKEEIVNDGDIINIRANA